MQALSLLVLQIGSLLFIATSLGALVNKNYYKTIFSSMFKNAGILYLSGFLALILGYMLITYHNIWESSPVVIVTIIGWMSLLKGVALLIFPKSVTSHAKTIMHSEGLPFFTLALGLVLGYLGFM